MTTDRARAHTEPEFASQLMTNLAMGGAVWDAEAGLATATIQPRAEQLELDGSIPFGMLAGISDNNNATANINSAGWDDNSILIEVSFQADRAPRGTVEMRSRNSAFNDLMGVAQGVMLDDEGSFGQAQCTSVTVPGRPMVGSGELPELPTYETVGGFPWESDFEPAPIDTYLQGGLVQTEGGAVYTTQLGIGWSSGYGSLHGGAVGLLITRAMRYAALPAAPADVDHVGISFNINYVRPAMVVPEPMEARARVIAVTSRFCTLEGELILPSGKPAARCRVIHRLVPKA
jgi:uncharacterized protein (TIGR00369 family)